MPPASFVPTALCGSRKEGGGTATVLMQYDGPLPARCPKRCPVRQQLGLDGQHVAHTPRPHSVVLQSTCLSEAGLELLLLSLSQRPPFLSLSTAQRDIFRDTKSQVAIHAHPRLVANGARRHVT